MRAPSRADGQQLATADKMGRHLRLGRGRRAASCTQLEAPGFYTWDPKQRIHSIGGTRSLAFSPDGKTLVVGGIGKIGNIDHLDGPAARRSLRPAKPARACTCSRETPRGSSSSFVFHPEGKWLVGLGGDNGGLIQFYDLAEKKVIKSDKAPMHVHAAALNEDGKQLFAAGHGKIAVWEIE